MSLSELSLQLKQMYEDAKDGEQIAMIMLFGIKYADIIKQSGYTPRDIVLNAKMKVGLSAELSKGIKLASYVVEK